MMNQQDRKHFQVVVLKLPQPDGESGTRAVGIIVEEGVDES